MKKDKDIARLREIDAELARVRRTESAISQTYESKFVSKKGRVSRRPFTKKRPFLYKDKEKQYAVLRGRLTVLRFNLSQERQKIVEKVFKAQPRLLP